MYDLPEISWALDQFWSNWTRRLRAAGVPDLPAKLTHGRHFSELMDDPNLLVSQCCGYDILHRYRETLMPIATPEYTAPGCIGGNYCSVVVVSDNSRFDDVRQMHDTVAAINGPESHSGMSALRQLVADHHVDGKFFSDVIVTGSHLASLALIRRGDAEVAAIDTVTLALIRRHRPQALAGIRELGTTYCAPAPPFVVSSNLPAEQVALITATLFDLFADPTLIGCLDVMMLQRICPASREDYWIINAFEQHASMAGYAELR